MIAALVFGRLWLSILRHRIEYIIIAVIAIVLASIQSSWFVAAGKTPISPHLAFGFPSKPKTVGGTIFYIFGGSLWLIDSAFHCLFVHWRKYAALSAFAMPFIFALYGSTHDRNGVEP